MDLTWHLDQQQMKQERKSIMHCSAWIEFGSRLNSKLVQPKLMWKSCSAKYCYPYSIDLLDICGIFHHPDENNNFNIRDFPFARKPFSFIIETTFGAIYVFEIPDRKTRLRIIHGLKLLVSELGSMVASGYGYMEYFTPTGFIDA